MLRRLALAITVWVVAASCTASARDPQPPLDDRTIRALDHLLADPLVLDVATIARTRDKRVAWILVDVLRFHQGQTHGPTLARSLSALTGVPIEPFEGSWVRYADHLLAQDVPAPPGYLKWKRKMFVGFHEGWTPFFDGEAAVDWRYVTWGGVLRDGIQSLNDPPVTPAPGGAWLPDDEIVFGLEVGGEQRAYPRRVLEAHEVANDTLGSRRVGLTYCTLCGSAIAYRLDADPRSRPIELRTTGLLNRSNKLMYDAVSESMFEQFNGRAVSGPLRRAGVRLEALPIMTTTWSEWRRANPKTTVLAEEIGGRTYLADQLGDRDKNGPIFPVGRIDPRLDAQTVVLGVAGGHGPAVAFPVSEAKASLKRSERVALAGVVVELEDGSLVARVSGDRASRTHQAFWFAWSQFNPGTLLWRDES